MKLTDQASEFDPRPITPKPLLEGPLAALLDWQAMAEGAYSANTLRAQKADGAIFQRFCESRSEPYLPADPTPIRAFIEDRVKTGKKPATIKRYVATIARVHVAAGLLNPCSSEAVRLGLKKMGRETSARQDQAHPLGWKDIKEFINTAGEGLRADRERAMLCVAYETLARCGYQQIVSYCQLMVSRIGRGDLRAVFFRRIAGIEAILPNRFRTRLIARNARMRRRPDRGAFRHLDLRWALPNQDS